MSNIVGDIVKLKASLLENPIDAVGVCFNNYGSGRQYIFENGNYDGFSEEEESEFLVKIGHSYEIENYKFKNVIQVSRDFEDGIFNVALIKEESDCESILEGDELEFLLEVKHHLELNKTHSPTVYGSVALNLLNRRIAFLERH